MLSDVLIILALVVGNGIFAGTELAILSVRKTRLHQLLEKKSAAAAAVQRLREAPERFLATVQIGITVIGATASVVGGATLAQPIADGLRSMGLGDSAEEVALSIVVVAVSYLSLVFGELVPKSLALRFSLGYALIVARPLWALSRLARPVVWFLTVSSNLVLRWFGDKTNFSESRLSPDELQQLLEEAGKTGSVNPKTSEIASRAFDLAGLTVADLMMPRNRVVAIPKDASADRLKNLFLESGHSRMPVYENDLDHIVGYVLAKDVLTMVFEKELIVLDDIIRPALFLPETKSAVDALQVMQQKKTQLALVVDEQGGLAGLVTIEDVVEELVGEILSEHEKPPEGPQHEGNGSWLSPGMMQIRDFNRASGFDLPEGDAWSTVGGLTTSLAGAIPEKGVTVTTEEGIILEVVDSSARRVRTVRVRRAAPKQEAEPKSKSKEEPAK